MISCEKAGARNAGAKGFGDAWRVRGWESISAGWLRLQVVGGGSRRPDHLNFRRRKPLSGLWRGIQQQRDGPALARFRAVSFR